MVISKIPMWHLCKASQDKPTRNTVRFLWHLASYYSLHEYGQRAYKALTNPSCLQGCNKCGMPNYSSSLLHSYSDIEHSNRFPPINNYNFPGPQFSSTLQRQRTPGQLHVDGSPSTNSNTTPNHVPDFPHSRKHDQIQVRTINFCSLISHNKQ